MRTQVGIIVFTPAGNTADFTFDKDNSNIELSEFINRCRVETASRYPIPPSWKNYNFAQWINNTWVEQYDFN